MGRLDRVSWRGEPITRGQRQALIATEEYIGREYRGFQFQMPQGSWQDQTDYSGTSHTRADVVDLWYAGLGYSTPAEKRKARYVWRALVDVGRQAAFFRGPWSKTPSDPDGMVLHFHVCDLNCEHAAETVRFFQVPEWRKGNDGLVAGRKDRFGYRPDPIRKWRFKG